MEYNGFNIDSDGVFSMKVITRIGSGKLPKRLMGAFTKTSEATKAIDAYLATKDVKDGAKVSTG